jgi:hypothetical protein
LLIAVDETNKRLILGLHRSNIDKLLNDMPIEKRLGREKGMPAELAAWTVYILGPEDLARFVAHFGVEDPGG